MAAKKQTREELTLPVEWDFIDASPGVSFDIGCSVMKLAYVAKGDYIEPAKRPKGSKGTLRLINFSRDDLSEAYDFIKEKAHIKRKSPDASVSVYSSGVGGTQFTDDFKTILNIKNYQIPEFECFIKSFMYLLTEVPRQDVLFPIYKPAFEEVKAEFKDAIKTMAHLNKYASMQSMPEVTTDMDNLELPQENMTNMDKPFSGDNIFPCILAMCGSGFAVMIINEDGSFSFADGSSRSGRTFLGLGSLLTGAKTYEELMDLCSRGQRKGVSFTTSSVRSEMKPDKDEKKDGGSEEKSKSEDMYKEWLDADDSFFDDKTLMCFGDCAGKSLTDYKREDVAICLLEMLVMDLATLVHQASIRKNIKHIFFTGGFVNQPLVRQILTSEWLRRDVGYRLMMNMDPEGEYKQVHFLKHGQSLGAIGALFNHKYQWTAVNNIPDSEKNRQSTKM